MYVSMYTRTSPVHLAPIDDGALLTNNDYIFTGRINRLLVIPINTNMIILARSVSFLFNKWTSRYSITFLKFIVVPWCACMYVQNICIFTVVVRIKLKKLNCTAAEYLKKVLLN